MHLKLTIDIMFLVALASISSSSAATCKCSCCAGNSCTPIQQGNLSVGSCSSCKAECQSRYPSVCTNGSGVFVFACQDVNTNGGLSSAGSTPNWLGVFRADNTCSRTQCCCVGGRVHLTRADDKNIRMQVQYEGNCPPGVSGADQTFAMPSGFSVQQSFSGQIFAIQLSEDSRKITVANQAFPDCSGNAIRDSAVSASINMSFVIFLCSLVTVKRFAF
ncbi:unnamed protein product [Rotaria magnacalcarata]|uniref:Uncharacterized protein n=1 Tax=Rotaria magnacalcarata TaxID=392030 RepID=A0A814V5Q5_9BILA|nr:unnamed protein product [Rotaria magnacalcarata]CAF3757522.1 unnamed protein product [Rotaria magnacalcarata]